MSTLKHRPRRWRGTSALRSLVRETSLSPSHLVWPLFIIPGKGRKLAVSSMPGVFQMSVDQIVKAARQASRLGIPAILLFGVPPHKDLKASGAYANDGIVQQAIRAVKDTTPHLAVMTDVCLCEYMSHGHCGVVRKKGARVIIENDATLELLARTAISHAEAGADIVAPSDMMDGRVRVIRKGLDHSHFKDVMILSYAVKYASAFYGPFRDAAQSTPHFGDRTSYQMDPANAREALKEVALDIREGADAIMVKPALPYLDVVTRVRERFALPVAAYQVSGEYAMLQAACQKGWLDEKKTTLESLLAIKRAGADFIVTYAAPKVAQWLSE